MSNPMHDLAFALNQRSPELSAVAPPSLPIAELNEHERGRASVIQANIDLMYDACQQYADAFALAQYCQRHMPVIDGGNLIASCYWLQWHRIAMHSAVMKARDYWEGFAVLKRDLHKVPTWSSSIDLAAIKTLGKEFVARFPDIGSARNAVAHPEAHGNPKEGMAPETSEPGGFYLKSLITPDSFEATFNRRRVACEVNLSSTRFLLENWKSVVTELGRALT